MLAIETLAKLSEGAAVLPMDEDVDPKTNQDQVVLDGLKVGPTEPLYHSLNQFRGDAPVQAPIAQDPEDLVLLTDKLGAVVCVAPVVAPNTGKYADRDFTITATETAVDIVVEYNADVAFQIIYVEATDTISAGLNSNIQGPKGGTSRAVANEVDLNGVDVMTVSLGKCFGGSTAITLVVDQEQIGTHLAQIDLTNPRDTLSFEFDSSFTGNLHLVYDERENDSDGDTSTTKRAFVIQTAANVTTLSGSAIAALIANPTGRPNTGTVLSEIYLGADSLAIEGDPASGAAYQIRIENFINEMPAISTNIGWTSVSEH